MKNWKRLLGGAALIVGTTLVSPANAVTCTVTDPSASTDSALDVSRTGNQTTVSATPPSVLPISSGNVMCS